MVVLGLTVPLGTISITCGTTLIGAPGTFCVETRAGGPPGKEVGVAWEVETGGGAVLGPGGRTP